MDGVVYGKELLSVFLPHITYPFPGVLPLRVVVVPLLDGLFQWTPNLSEAWGLLVGPPVLACCRGGLNVRCCYFSEAPLLGCDPLTKNIAPSSRNSSNVPFGCVTFQIWYLFHEGLCIAELLPIYHTSPLFRGRIVF